MTTCSYSFCMSLLHSLWQSGILLLLYWIFNQLFLRNNSPIARRNFLFALLLIQIIAFITGFVSGCFLSPTTLSNELLNTIAIPFISTQKWLAFAPYLFMTYWIILAYKLAQSFLSWNRFKQQYVQGLEKPSIDLKLFTATKAHQFGIRRKVTLWFSTHIHTPVTFRFFKPVILLPVALVNQISTDQAETLILHELSHIKSNDYLLNWVLIITEKIFFFNPFFSSICSSIRLEREKSCDINVLDFEYSPTLYASTLVQAERLKRSTPEFQLAAVNRKKQLLHRIEFFTNSSNFNKKTTLDISGPIIGLLLLFAIYTAVLFNSGFSSPQSAGTGILPMTLQPQYNRELNEMVFENTGYQEPVIKKLNQRPAAVKYCKSAPAPNNPAILNIAMNDSNAAELFQPGQPIAMNIAEKTNNGSRQIVIKEESSGLKSSTVKVYWLKFENGKWVLQPDWMLAARKIEHADSTYMFHDSSMQRNRVYPLQ